MVKTLVASRSDCSAIRESFVDTVGELKVSPVFPKHERHTRHSLPYGGSRGPWFPTYYRYYGPLRLPLPIPFGSLVAPYRYLSVIPLLCVPHLHTLLRFGSLTPGYDHTSMPGLLIWLVPLIFQHSSRRRQEALPSSRVTPVDTCPAHRPRWYPDHLP